MSTDDSYCHPTNSGEYRCNKKYLRRVLLTGIIAGVLLGEFFTGIIMGVLVS